MEKINICQHADICGGCEYQGVEYIEQLNNKEKEVQKYLDKRGLKPEVKEPIVPSPLVLGYRNKMEYTFGNLAYDSPIELGMHEKNNFMNIVTTDHCQLCDEDFNTILRVTLDFVKEKNYPFYHKKTHEGMLRYLSIRKGVRTNELLVSIVTASVPGFDEEEYVNRLLELKLNNKIIGILRIFEDNMVDQLRCESEKVLYGRNYYIEEILGIKFKVHLLSFFQTNISAIERLYSDAINLLDSFENKVCYDLFSGTGTIAQIMSLKAKKVYGVEINHSAVESAKENIKLNNITNVEMLEGDCFDVLDNITEKPDVIVVDPPRNGIEPKTLDKLISYGVNEILYISCNPKTLADNLYYFEFYGYKTKYLRPYDNFPNTKHVETVVLLSKVNTQDGSTR